MASQVESIKWLPGTRFMVDGFAFTNTRCQHYFLTHFHSDHTIGLRRGFEAGVIYASPVTAALLTQDFGLRPDVVRVLEVGVRAVIEGVGVTPIDANHCPGAVMFLFEVPKPGGGVEVILHTGDCRWQDWIKERSVLASVKVDTLFLDTTYCLPRHDFPPQQAAIDAMVQAIREVQAQEPATLVVVSSYHIGKERAFFGAARQLGCKIYCTKAKRKVLALLDLPHADMELLTDEPFQAGLHVAAAMGMKHESLVKYLTPDGPWKQVVGIRPTGWTFRKSGGPTVWREGATVIIGVPYSEHSSWSDLRACVAAIRPKRIVPTVNARDAAASRAIVDRFAGLMDLSRDRSRLDAWLSAAKPQRVLLPLGPPPLAPGESLACPQDTSGCKDDVTGAVDEGAGCADAKWGSHGDGAGGCADECAPCSAPGCVGNDAWGSGTAQHSRHCQEQQPHQGKQLPVLNGQPLPLQASTSGLCEGTELFALPNAATADGSSANHATASGATASVQGDVDLGGVDLDEQARIWEQLQRHKRIRESIAAQQQASKKLKRRSSSGGYSGGGGSSSSGASAQTQQGEVGAPEALAGAGAVGSSPSTQSSIKAFFGFFAGRR